MTVAYMNELQISERRLLQETGQFVSLIDLFAPARNAYWYRESFDEQLAKLRKCKPEAPIKFVAKFMSQIAFFQVYFYLILKLKHHFNTVK